MKPQEAFQKASQRIVGNHALLVLLLHHRCNFAFDDHDSTLLPDALSMCRGGADYTPEKITTDSKIEPRRHRNRLSETPESFWGHQNQAEIGLGRSERAQECPRAPKLVQSSSSQSPSRDRRRPSWRQVGPKSAQVGAKRRPRSCIG